MDINIGLILGVFVGTWLGRPMVDRLMYRHFCGGKTPLSDFSEDERPMRFRDGAIVGAGAAGILIWLKIIHMLSMDVGLELSLGSIFLLHGGIVALLDQIFSAVPIGQSLPKVRFGIAVFVTLCFFVVITDIFL